MKTMSSSIVPWIISTISRETGSECPTNGSGRCVKICNGCAPSQEFGIEADTEIATQDLFGGSGNFMSDNVACRPGRNAGTQHNDVERLLVGQCNANGSAGCPDFLQITGGVIGCRCFQGNERYVGVAHGFNQVRGCGNQSVANTLAEEFFQPVLRNGSTPFGNCHCQAFVDVDTDHAKSAVCKTRQRYRAGSAQPDNG